MQQLFENAHSVRKDVTELITDQVKKICFTDNIDNSLILSNDVCTDIRTYLYQSPFHSKKVNNKIKEKEAKKWRKNTLTKYLNKQYHEKYLEIEEEIYTLSKKKMDQIKLNFKFFIPHDEKCFRCLACNINVSKELYTLYEHMCIQSHINNVNQFKKSNVAELLLKEYIKKWSSKSVQCYSCGSSFPSHFKSISNHIHSIIHKRNYNKFYNIIDNTFKSILQDLDNLWYSIQRFSCTLCETNFKYKIEFIEHIIAKHSESFKNYIFDFCIPCTTLWMCQKDSYTEHCSDIMHKYLASNKDFMIENFPECIKKLLTKVNETVNILFEETQVLLNDNIQEEVRQSIENTVRLYFPSSKAFLFGSRVTGLGFTSSDIDIYVDCENTYYKSKTEALRILDLKCIEQALCMQKEQWKVKKMLEATRTPIIKLIYIRTGVECDISVTNGLSVENSKLLRSFNDAYLPCRKLILFIKKWFSLFNLSVNHGFTNYALSLIVIFYLQSESHLPSVATLIKQKNKSQSICGWETGVAQPVINNEFVEPIPVLLLGFFKFYANFDYQHYIICPLMGFLLAKKVFVKLDALPKEMEPYIKQLKTSKEPEYFRIDSSLCVQDPFDLSHNVTKSVNSISLKCFKQYCQDSASILSSTMH